MNYTLRHTEFIEEIVHAAVIVAIGMLCRGQCIVVLLTTRVYYFIGGKIACMTTITQLLRADQNNAVYNNCVIS